MLITNLSFHAQVERLDRCITLLTELGMNSIIKEQKARDNRTLQLTDTGIVLVFNGEQLITMYLPHLEMLYYIYGSRHLPTSVYAKYKNNTKLRNKLAKLY